jgi:hypothetical protein
VLSDGPYKEGGHVYLTLLVHGFGGNNESGAVVEKRVFTFPEKH